MVQNPAKAAGFSGSCRLMSYPPSADWRRRLPVVHPHRTPWKIIRIGPHGHRWTTKKMGITDGYWWLLMVIDGYWWFLMVPECYWWFGTFWYVLKDHLSSFKWVRSCLRHVGSALWILCSLTMEHPKKNGVVHHDMSPIKIMKNAYASHWHAVQIAFRIKIGILSRRISVVFVVESFHHLEMGKGLLITPKSMRACPK